MFRKILVANDGSDGAPKALNVRLTPHVLAGHEVKTIVTFVIEHRFDVLGVGFMGQSKILGQHWGSTSQNLTRLAPCSVLVVK